MINKPIGITFRESEVILAGNVAVMRHAQNVSNQVRQKYAAEHTKGLERDFDGALGEVAVAKWLNIFWNGNIGRYNAPDVGPLQVRATRADPPHLYLHPPDKDDDMFVLVQINRGVAYIHSWCYAREGKDPRFWGDLYQHNRPAYFVPHDSEVMRPFDAEFKQTVERLISQTLQRKLHLV